MAHYVDAPYYLQAKLAQLQDTDELDANGKPYTLDSLQKALTAAGLTPEQHYVAYGRSEHLQPSAYFNENEYLQAKLQQLQNNADKATAAQWQGKSTDDVLTAITDAGLTPVEHYEQYGAFETDAKGCLINPSNAFDANAYVAAKLAQMRATGESLHGKAPADLSPVEVLVAIKAAGFSPVSHYMIYGAHEANASGVALVQTVPVGQRVENDFYRQDNTPANYNPNSAGPDTAQARPVPKPADVGGKTDPGISPPVVMPKAPFLVPTDPGYVAPPPSLVDSNEHPAVLVVSKGGIHTFGLLDPASKTIYGINSDGSMNTVVIGTVDAVGAIVASQPDPVLVPMLVASPNLLDSGTVNISGTTGNTGDRADITLIKNADGSESLQVTGQSLATPILWSIEAPPVRGYESLHIDVTQSTNPFLYTFGSKYVSNDITVKSTEVIVGGRQSDTLTITGNGVSFARLGLGHDRIILEGVNAKQDLKGCFLDWSSEVEGRLIESRLDLLLGKDGVGTNYTGNIKIYSHCSLGFDEKGVGTTDSSININSGSIDKSLTLYGGVWNGSILGSDKADLVVVKEDTTIKQNITLGQSGDTVRIAGGKTLTVTNDNVHVQDGGSLTIARDGAGVTTLAGSVMMNSKGTGTSSLTLTDITLSGMLFGDEGADTVVLKGDASISGALYLRAGNDIVDMTGLTSTTLLDIYLAESNATSFTGSASFNGIETIKTGGHTNVSLTMFGYTALSGTLTQEAWDTSGTTKGIRVVNALSDISGNTDNKAYVLRGNVTEGTGGTFNANSASGNDLLLVFDSNGAVNATHMECVLLTGVGSQVGNLAIGAQGTIGFSG